MLKKIVLLFLVLSFAGVLIMYFFGSKILGKSIKSGVETFGPQVTQTKVLLDNVEISVLSGNGQLSGLYVGNPEGFKSENIFALEQVAIDINPRSLLSDEIVINKIYIKEPHISYEKTLRTSNLKELLKNIEESTGGSETLENEELTTEEVAQEESEPGKDILIKEFVIENPNVFLGIAGFGATVPLPSIELTDISSSEEKIAATLLKQVIEKIAENIKTATTDVSSETKDTTKDIFDSFKDQSEEPIKQINDGLKNLFGK